MYGSQFNFEKKSSSAHPSIATMSIHTYVQYTIECMHTFYIVNIDTVVLGNFPPGEFPRKVPPGIFPQGMFPPDMFPP